MNLSKTYIGLLSLLLFPLYVTAQNQPPVLTATGNQVYCPGTALNIVTNMDITDPDDNSIDAIYIQISSGYQLGQDQLILTGTHPTIAATWNASEGKLTLRSPSFMPVLYSEFKNAIEDVVYTSSIPNPSGTREFSISVGQANYLPSNEHYYAYVPVLGITWNDAKNAASLTTYYGLQGYLATITAADEAQLSGEQAAGAGWIGGSDVESEGTWKWMTGPENGTVFWNGGANGSSPNFANWNSGEPNNLGNENYAHVTAPGVGTPGAWNDLSNEGSTSGDYQPKGYIVEYGGMPGDPELHIATSSTILIPGISTTTVSSSCGPAILNLSVGGVGNMKWYDNATGGNLLATGNNFTTPLLTATTTYYVDAFEPGCLTASRVAVTATINDIPVLQVGPPAPACEGPVTLHATVNAGQIRWYDQQTNGTLLATGESFTTPILTQDTTYYVDAKNNDCTSGPRQEVLVNINQKPVVADEQTAICEGEEATLDAGISNVTYLWSTGSTARQITVDTEGSYTVTVTNPAGCSSVKTFTVIQKQAPVISEIVVLNNTATIKTANTGAFEYAVDNGSFQASNNFTFTQGGLHTAHVRQVDGCGEDSRDFIIVIVPTFFTPNSDNVNDMLIVPGMALLPESSMSIFDRYGKLIAVLNPRNTAWNGTLKGRPLPADDYWYVMKVSNTQPEIKGHFSLYR
ncbi:MAG: lectin [Flavobacterium sp. BFFFF1]|uniref:Ig-like domain-containing protein n=1 Tax=Flavobacterium sp. BFFFF1 TaxID=2015557 RepID=UPI000BD658C0|nr:T9SS type B sorting domain-containing protein [Flavobacterium sp. BFFFF1]OYU79500.1 MAG: lectin [Flavobacterium sp. BFFFF1]